MQSLREKNLADFKFCSCNYCSKYQCDCGEEAFFFLQPQLTCYHGNIWAATLTVKLVIKINFGMTVNGTILTMGIVPLSKVCAQLSPERKKIMDDSSPWSTLKGQQWTFHWLRESSLLLHFSHCLGFYFLWFCFCF